MLQSLLKRVKPLNCIKLNNGTWCPTFIRPYWSSNKVRFSRNFAPKTAIEVVQITCRRGNHTDVRLISTQSQTALQVAMYLSIDYIVHRLVECGTVFVLVRFLFLVFSYFSVSVPCARLSWPYRQLLSARKYIV